MKKILILGGTGMLGHTLFAYLSGQKEYNVYATSRHSNKITSLLSGELSKQIRTNVEADNFDSIIRAFASIQPDCVINCIGLIKQLPLASDPLNAITVNSQLPHRISLICRTAGARLIHISTDCVFDGENGNYTEEDLPNAKDIYGRTKFLGEVSYPHCTTLRTSIIGHELKGFYGLIEWFLRQKDPIKGYKKAIFSGLPTIELAHIIGEYVIPNVNLQGVYQVASNTISKYDLLKAISEKYKKNIDIIPDEDFKINRTLDAALFNKTTGYNPPSWDILIEKMHRNFLSSSYYSGHKHDYQMSD